jgi:hypothetical protein
VSRRAARLAASLRTCPLCCSIAVTQMRMEKLSRVTRRCVLLCGGCGTWRGTELDVRDVHAVERRFARNRRRDRRQLARALRQLELVSSTPERAQPATPSPPKA